MARALSILLSPLLVLGCQGDAESPEARIRAVIAEIAEAVEAKDVGRVKEHVADDFEDAHGRDRRELAQLLTFHTMRNQNVHVMTRIRDVVLREDGRAAVEIVAATAGRPIPEAMPSAGLRADVYRIEADFEDRGGDWLLVWAQWTRATPAELF
jgi:ketosteroid isomerase-like protein